MNNIPYGKAICYSGYREGQSPKTKVPSKEEIAEDLEILAKDGYRYLRMYDPNDHARRVLEIIREKKLPMKCLIGIDSDPEVNNPGCPWERQDRTEEELEANKRRNDGELEKLIAMAKEFDEEIFALSIGNENTPEWGAHMVTEERLVEHADKLKAATGKPITFCEGVFEWPHLKELPKHLDFISVHSYPWHYGKTVDVAAKMNADHYYEMKDLFRDKQVIFTELGWTTNSCGNANDAQASVRNQETYIKELTAWLEKEQVIAFIFEAFDEPWKASAPEKSECNWGLYTVDRIKKW